MSPHPVADGTDEPRFAGNELAIALAVGVGVLMAAFAAPAVFPLAGAGGEKLPYDLQRTFTTAWAAMIASTPAFATFLFRRTSRVGAGWWLAFWTAGCAVFVVHFCWAVFVFFGGDWSRILHSPQFVTLPRFDTFMTVWWVADVALAWLVRSEGIVIRVQRWIVHVLLLLLFLAGSLKEGNYTFSLVVGGAMAAVVLAAGAVRVRARAMRKRVQNVS